jgi:hypothetical protein
MRTSAIAAAVLALAPLTTSCFPADLSQAAWNGPPFSADLVNTNEPTKGPARIYLGNGKMRMEGGDPNDRSALVFDPAHHGTLLISDKNRTYIDAGMFTSLLAAGFAPLMRFVRPVGTGDPCAGWNSAVHSFTSFVPQQQRRNPPQLTCHDLGGDNINGRPAEKWAVTSSVDSESGTLWIDQRLHIVSKAVDKHSAMEMRNIHEGAQPAGIFEPPAGYEKLSITTMLSKLGKQSQQNTSSGSTPAP